MGFFTMDWTDRLLLRESKLLATHWFHIRDKDILPTKSRLQPKGIKEILPYLTILEIIENKEVHFRLFGTDLVRRINRDLTGKTFRIEPTDGSRSPFHQTCLDIVSQPCAASFVFRDIAAGGQRPMTEAVGFPLADGFGNHRYIVWLSKSFKQNKHTLENCEYSESETWFRHEYLDIGKGTPEPRQPEKLHFMIEPEWQTVDRMQSASRESAIASHEAPAQTLGAD